MVWSPSGPGFSPGQGAQRGLIISFVTRPSSTLSPIPSGGRFSRSRFKHLESIGIEPAEISKSEGKAAQNYLQTFFSITLRYPKYKNKSLHRRFFLDSAPQL